MRNVAALLMVLLLSGCLAAGAMGSLLGGGPKVAANGQAGSTNSQTVGNSAVTRPTIKGSTANVIRQTGTSRSTVQAERVRQVVVTPWYAITPAGVALAFIVWLATFFYAWLHLPSGKEMGRGVRNWLAQRLFRPTGH